MDLSAFLQVYPIRAPNIMWMLGAGASAAANIPTAEHMIWDFKRRLYCAAQRVPLAACTDLSDAALRQRLQEYFDKDGSFPRSGADDEYAAFVEAMYPDEADRRRYIEQHALHGTPSLGHLALAAMLRHDRTHIIWTTNFDRVVEDAVAKIFGTGARLTVATIDTAGVALEALNEGRWPLLVKLHGDFQSRRLKNTAKELQAEEQALEMALTEACRRYGLAVVGYSGRDASVIRALTAALDAPGAFPQGLFWFHRGTEAPFANVTRLLERASASGVHSHLLECQSFDELMADLVQQFEELPPELRASFDYRTRRVSDAPPADDGDAYPVIRLNAIPVTAAPTTCRLVACTIGGMREVRAAVQAAGVDLIVARRKVGVLVFGPDDAARRAFGPYGIASFDLHAIPLGRLAYESAEQGLLTEAVARGLTRERPLQAIHRRSGYVVTVDPARQGEPLLRPLADVTGSLVGTVPNSATTQSRTWREAVSIRLEQRYGRLWLLIEPTIWVERAPGEPLDDTSKEFVRARLAQRYNAKVNALLDAWTSVVTGGAAQATLLAFGDIEGVNAGFTVHKTAAFSRRISGRRSRHHANGGSA